MEVMVEGYDILEYQNSNIYVLEIPSNTRYFYNDRHKILRVRKGTSYYDFPCLTPTENPDPARHVAMCIVPDKVLDENAIVSERLDLPPGWTDNEGTLADMGRGFCYLINRSQSINTTNPQNSQAGFAISNTNMFDKEQVVYAISPPLEGRDYTTKEAKSDLNAESIGIFINRDGTILVKSRGGSITLGDEGVHIGGKFITESSTVDTGPLSDNTISDIIGSTLPTAVAAWPKLPNIGFIANIAAVAVKFISIGDKAKRGIETAKSLRNIFA